MSARDTQQQETRLPDADLTVLVERAAEGIWNGSLAVPTGTVWAELDGTTKNEVREQALPVIFHGTKALADLGYRKPRTITTVEELRTLHEGVFGIDADGLLWQIEGSGACWINVDEGEDETYGDDDIKLPFTVYGGDDL